MNWPPPRPPWALSNVPSGRTPNFTTGPWGPPPPMRRSQESQRHVMVKNTKDFAPRWEVGPRDNVDPKDRRNDSTLSLPPPVSALSTSGVHTEARKDTDPMAVDMELEEPVDFCGEEKTIARVSPTAKHSGIKVNLLRASSSAAAEKSGGQGFSGIGSPGSAQREFDRQVALTKPPLDGIKSRGETPGKRFAIPEAPRIADKLSWEYPTPAAALMQPRKRDFENPFLPPPGPAREDKDRIAERNIPPAPPLIDWSSGDTIPLLLGERSKRSASPRGENVRRSKDGDSRSASSRERSRSKERRGSRSRDSRERGTSQDWDEKSEDKSREEPRYLDPKSEADELEQYEQEFNSFKKEDLEKADDCRKVQRGARWTGAKDGKIASSKLHSRDSEATSRSQSPGFRPAPLSSGEASQSVNLPSPMSSATRLRSEGEPYSGDDLARLDDGGAHRLPPEWTAIPHRSGRIAYVHRATRTVTLSRPYVLGPQEEFDSHSPPPGALPDSVTTRDGGGRDRSRRPEQRMNPECQQPRDQRLNRLPAPPVDPLRGISSAKDGNDLALRQCVKDIRKSPPQSRNSVGHELSATKELGGTPQRQEQMLERNEPIKRFSSPSLAVTAPDIVEYKLTRGDQPGLLLRLPKELTRRQVLVELCKAAYPTSDPPKFEYMDDGGAGMMEVYFSRCLFKGQVAGMGFGKSKMIALEDACTKTVRGLEPELPIDDFNCQQEKLLMFDKLKSFYENVPMGQVELLQRWSKRPISDGNLKVFPTQLLSALLGVDETEIRSYCRIFRAANQQAGRSVEVVVSIPKIRKSIRYVCNADSMLGTVATGGGDVGPEEEKLLKQLASHKMILRDYPKMKTWWDAVKVWWQLKEGHKEPG